MDMRCFFCNVYFNSQPHEEADFPQLVEQFDEHISTHSLTKRLTSSWPSVFTVGQHFNSQPHEEAD